VLGLQKTADNARLAWVPSSTRGYGTNPSGPRNQGSAS
jgi:hypothetical protein